MESIILQSILSYLIGLAVNLRTDAILSSRKERLKAQLERENNLPKALTPIRPLRDEVRSACAELVRNRGQLGLTPREESLWGLLSGESFQADVTEWLMAGGIEEGAAVKARLLSRIEVALAQACAAPEQIALLRNDYFDALDKAVFAYPALAQWRHHLSLNYLRDQVAMLRQRADEAAGKYSPEKQTAALDRYVEMSLTAWDIIDLSNLPEGDIHLATQKLLLRQLYMPLRIAVEPNDPGGDSALAGLEERREARRRREAGHLFDGELGEAGQPESRAPVGERLAASRRLVVLGDPGGGKTTMLRWMATAYLLRYKRDGAFGQIPDTETLPAREWIAVLIRCRDLGVADLCRSFVDFLTQHLRKTELLPEEADVMRAVILDRIARGEALLLVDGLDEIADPQVRMMFCQELERTAARYPEAPIVVTSRIVGYRDMPYRMGSGFEHSQIAELSREDKDLFARRWVEVTEQHQPAAERARRARELLDDLHSSDRIERLTGNPMLLTTLALVKRKVGKLPNRRTKLYAEAVSVLLNWNPRVYKAIEEDEAIPQLEYLAYEMCRRGVQRLTEEAVLDLLDKLRTDYPNIRAVRRREPHEFLNRLEERSGILIKSGGIWEKDKDREQPVWEFRHLTFQEYLAAHALLDGRYPGRDKTKSLAEQVAPLVGALEKAKGRWLRESEDEMDVPESWREALRLLVADCKDDDVDEVLLSILNPQQGENPRATARPRAVLAALCLADEPNVSEESAQRVLAAFASAVSGWDGGGLGGTTLDSAAMEVGRSMWVQRLKESLMKEYCRRPPQTRDSPGSLWGIVEVSGWAKSGLEPAMSCAALVGRLQSGERVEVLSAALTAMRAAFEEKATNVPGLTDGLLMLLEQDWPESRAAAWALVWMTGWSSPERNPVWLPSEPELEVLLRALSRAPNGEPLLKRCLIGVLGKSSSEKSLSAVASKLDDPDPDIRSAVVGALATKRNNEAETRLLSRDLNRRGPWIDPNEPITEPRLVAAAKRLGMTLEEVRALYVSMADDFHLRFA